MDREKELRRREKGGNEERDVRKSKKRIYIDREKKRSDERRNDIGGETGESKEGDQREFDPLNILGSPHLKVAVYEARAKSCSILRPRPVAQSLLLLRPP